MPAESQQPQGENVASSGGRRRLQPKELITWALLVLVLYIFWRNETGGADRMEAVLRKLAAERNAGTLRPQTEGSSPDVSTDRLTPAATKDVQPVETRQSPRTPPAVDPPTSPNMFPAVPTPVPNDGVNDPYILRMERQAKLRESCPVLDVIRKAIVSGQCDICGLVPILEGYADEVDLVVEAGSRHGSSTAAFLNRHPKQFRSMELEVQGPLKLLHQYQKHCERNDDAKGTTAIDEGDDVKVGLQVKPVPLLFLDTLHNADQLYKELEVFPMDVSQWMILHDTYSYTKVDEVPDLKRPDVPPEVRKWRGLHKPIAHFLKHKQSDWQEEMNFVHSNGLYVVRRRSAALKVVAPSVQRKNWITENSRSYGVDSMKGVLEFIVKHRGWKETQCRVAFQSIGKRAPGALCDTPAYEAPTMGLYTPLVGSSDSVAIFSRVGFLFGHAMPATSVAMVVGKQLSHLEEAIDALMLVVLTVAQDQKPSQRKLHVYMAGEGEPEISKTMASTLGGIRERWQRVAAVDGLNGKSVVFVNAATLREYAASETFNADHRIVVYGTAMADASRYAPAGFELTTALNAAIGFAMWEKSGSQAMHYYVSNPADQSSTAFERPTRPPRVSRSRMGGA